MLVATGKVATILDGRSFVLDDGREVRLAAIEVPRPGRRTGPAAAAAKAALESAPGRPNRGVAPAGAGGRPLRPHRSPMSTSPATGRPVRSAQEMLAQGYARVGAQVGDPACAAELLSRERVARAAKLGLWADPYYVIVGAESGAELLAERGRFTVVEGKVLSVRESGGTIYVNFGRRWSEALTVTILKRHERIFARPGCRRSRCENRRVRVRGWIEERNGPADRGQPSRADRDCRT